MQISKYTAKSIFYKKNPYKLWLLDPDSSRCIRKKTLLLKGSVETLIVRPSNVSSCIIIEVSIKQCFISNSDFDMTF